MTHEELRQNIVSAICTSHIRTDFGEPECYRPERHEADADKALGQIARAVFEEYKIVRGHTGWGQRSHATSTTRATTLAGVLKLLGYHIETESGERPSAWLPISDYRLVKDVEN
jgi:hypothetical protein